MQDLTITNTIVIIMMGICYMIQVKIKQEG